MAKIGSHPQNLLYDKAGEINSKKIDELLLAKGCNHICLPKNEHYGLGVPEQAVGDLDRNTRAVMTDDNIPPAYWDVFPPAGCFCIQELLSKQNRQNRS